MPLPMQFLFNLTLSLLALILLSGDCRAQVHAGIGHAAPPVTHAGVPASIARPGSDEPAAPDSAARAANLAALVKQYKGRPDAYSWDLVWKSVRDLLTQPAACKMPAGSLLSSYPALTELGVRVSDGEGARIWTFPKINESQYAIVQWTATTVTVIGRPVRHRPAREIVTVAAHAQVISLPTGVVITDAHIEHAMVVGKDKKVKPGAVKALVLSGNAKASGAVWLASYKMTGDTWVESTEIFSAIPPFLVQNLVGRASFEGNDLVLTIGSGKSAGKSAGGSEYKIVLHFVDGRFSLDAKSSEEGPAFVVLQFMQSVQSGHLDIAKGWLVDQRLISIPKYAGFTKPTAQGYKLLSMANPSAGVSRYRVMSAEKNDLILDVAKVKQQWAIKGVFIVPPDPLAQKLLGTVPSATDKPVDKAADVSKPTP